MDHIRAMAPRNVGVHPGLLGNCFPLPAAQALDEASYVPRSLRYRRYQRLGCAPQSMTVTGQLHSPAYSPDSRGPLSQQAQGNKLKGPLERRA